MNQIDYRGEQPVACSHPKCPDCLRGQQLSLGVGVRPVRHANPLYHSSLCDGTDLQATFDHLVDERNDLQVELAMRGERR